MDLLDASVKYPNNWYRFEWKEYKKTVFEAFTKAGTWKNYKAIWEDGFHRSKLETLYTVMVHGGLSESDGKKNGRRIKDGKPGLYMFSTPYKEKAWN